MSALPVAAARCRGVTSEASLELGSVPASRCRFTSDSRPWETASWMVVRGACAPQPAANASASPAVNGSNDFISSSIAANLHPLPLRRHRKTPYPTSVVSDEMGRLASKQPVTWTSPKHFQWSGFVTGKDPGQVGVGVVLLQNGDQYVPVVGGDRQIAGADKGFWL